MPGGGGGGGPATVFVVAGIGNDYDGNYYDSGEVDLYGSVIYTNGTRFAAHDTVTADWDDNQLKYYVSLGDASGHAMNVYQSGNHPMGFS